MNPNSQNPEPESEARASALPMVSGVINWVLTIYLFQARRSVFSTVLGVISWVLTIYLFVLLVGMSLFFVRFVQHYGAPGPMLVFSYFCVCSVVGPGIWIGHSAIRFFVERGGSERYTTIDVLSTTALVLGAGVILGFAIDAALMRAPFNTLSWVEVEGSTVYAGDRPLRLWRLFVFGAMGCLFVWVARRTLSVAAKRAGLWRQAVQALIIPCVILVGITLLPLETRFENRNTASSLNDVDAELLKAEQRRRMDRIERRVSPFDFLFSEPGSPTRSGRSVKIRPLSDIP